MGISWRLSCDSCGLDGLILSTFSLVILSAMIKRIASIAPALLVSLSALALAPAAEAGDRARIEARIAAWGSACKNAVAVRHPKSTMADISVELGATLRQSIDAGQTTLQDVERNGLSFNWSYRNHTGYCNTDGAGNVVDLKKFQ